jgi:hypothetical protein
MKILAYDYEIKAQPAPVEQIVLMGRHDANALRITICTGMDKQHQESTLIHEVLEAINWQLQIKLEEQQIICLEVGLYNVLQNTGVDLGPLMKELEIKE